MEIGTKKQTTNYIKIGIFLNKNNEEKHGDDDDAYDGADTDVAEAMLWMGNRDSRGYG